MSDNPKPKTPGSLPENLAAEAGMPAGSSARSLHQTPPKDAPSPGSLDPHARSADHTLRPDPKGAGDSIGTADHDPHARSGDHSFRPDPTGSRDPLPGAAADLRARASDYSGQARGKADDLAGKARDTADDLAGQARDVAGDLADRARDRFGAAAGRASDLADQLRGQARDTADQARDWASDVRASGRRRAEDLRDRGQARLDQGRTAVEQFVSENPLLVGVVGVAAGLLLGALLPRTRQEDRNLGPWADEVRDQGLRYAREFTHQGRAFVERALDPDNLQAAAEQPGGQSPRPGQPGQGAPRDDRTAHRL
ncbi:hypothetical protein [Methylobacterium sp. A54F]